MKPKRIILIRHGESESNADRNQRATVPDYAVNLTHRGQEQARQAGQQIRAIIGAETLYVYMSPYYRTRQTWQCIEESVRPNVVRALEDPRLREQDWGHLRHPDEGEEIAKKRKSFSTFYYRIPDGESGADVYDRLSTYLETLYRDFEKPDYAQNVLIVTHGFALRLFLMRWFHWSIEEFENLRNPKNCQVVVMEQESGGRYKLVTELVKRK